MQLNDRQLQAVKHGNYPLLILAGAGTGKTTTILNRIEYAVNYNSIPPSSILALTFSVEATENLKSKLLDKDIPNHESISVSTFHSFAKNIIDVYYKELGYSSNPVIVEKDDLVHLFSERIDSFDSFNSKRYNRFPVKAIKSLLSIHDQFCQELLGQNDLDRIKESCLNNLDGKSDDEDEINRQIIDSIICFHDFRKIKKELSIIEYEDMIYDLWNLINLNTDVLLELQKEYKFIIIDEFQDNNYAFSKIVNKIASSHQNITVVGDDDQSIYSFRGANSFNMHDFDYAYINNSNYKKIELIRNYRSQQNILDVANSVIVNNDNRMDKEFLISDSNNAENNSVKLCIGDPIAQISKIVNSLKKIQDDNFKGSIAILCRTHSDCMSIAGFLNANGIMHDYDKDRLFDQKLIKDIMSILNVISGTKYSRHSLIRLSKDQFSAEFVEKIIKLDCNDNVLLNHCLNDRDNFKEDEYNWLMRIKSLSKYTSNSALIDSSARFLKNDITEIDSYIIGCLKDLIVNHDRLYKKNNINKFCNYMNLISDNNNVVIEKNNQIVQTDVRLMTVHNSKGMEFDIVFIPFLQSSKFPQANRKVDFATSIPLEYKSWAIDSLDEKNYHMEEERRLFYVAVTRAKKELYLLSTDKRRSKFLGEISDDLYDLEIIEPDLGMNLVEEEYSETYSRKDCGDSLLNLSASKINNYTRCQLRYKYSSLDLIPSFQYNAFFTIGNIIHKVLQKFHENHLKSYDDIVQILDEHWIDNMYTYECESKQYYQDAKDMLANYIMYLDDNPPTPILFERYFKIKLKDCFLSGVIDRVDIDRDGHLTIYDYKTSKTQKTINQLKKEIQLPIYALAMHYSGPDMHDLINSEFESISLGELSLRFNDLERKIELTKKEIQELEGSINCLAKEISSGVFKASPGYMNCSYCDYKKFICSYYN